MTFPKSLRTQVWRRSPVGSGPSRPTPEQLTMLIWYGLAPESRYACNRASCLGSLPFTHSAHKMKLPTLYARNTASASLILSSMTCTSSAGGGGGGVARRVHSSRMSCWCHVPDVVQLRGFHGPCTAEAVAGSILRVGAQVLWVAQ